MDDATSGKGRDGAVRAMGQIFTPAPLVRVLLALAGIGTGFRGRVLDPACGTGAILHQVGSKLGPGGGMHGVERDPHLARQAMANLSPWRSRCTIEIADALSRLETLSSRFDRVVANPPYVPWHRIPPLVRSRLEQGGYGGCLLRGRPRHRDQQPDLCLFFLILGVHALREGGRLAYLIPHEWLTAGRTAVLRDWLLEQMTVRCIVRFGKDMPLFRDASSGRASTSSMILVAEKRPAPPGHRVGCLEVSASSGQVEKVLDALADWALNARVTAPPGWSKPVHLRQDAWPGRPWSRAGGEDVSLRRTVPLGSLPGVHVVGGHQPRVSWLAWLELDDLDHAALPEQERAWLFPAVRNPKEITFPVMKPTGRWWVFFPAGLGRYAEVEALAPSLARVVAARFEAACREPEKLERWWAFPNPRNLNLVRRRIPRLIIPRTADALRASFDPFHHMIKGTNTLVMAEPASDYSIHALAGLLNSSRLRALAATACPDYHGVRKRLEPAVIKQLPVPVLDSQGRKERAAAVAARVREALHGAGDWEVVDRVANTLYE